MGWGPSVEYNVLCTSENPSSGDGGAEGGKTRVRIDFLVVSILHSSRGDLPLIDHKIIILISEEIKIKINHGEKINKQMAAAPSKTASQSNSNIPKRRSTQKVSAKSTLLNGNISQISPCIFSLSTIILLQPFQWLSHHHGPTMTIAQPLE